MVIVRISGSVGNQLFQYAAGRQLAHKLNTELKLDVSWFENNHLAPYALEQFNITGKVAMPEEIEPLKKVCMDTGLGKEGRAPIQQVLTYPDNIYLDGDWWSERYFPDIRDLLLKEITIKNPLSPSAETLKRKILSAKCAVSMHFHHGDFLYNPIESAKPWFHVPPLEYYYNCINTLKQAYKNSTVFVFSNNMQWIKENLRLDVLTEFVEGLQEDKKSINYLNRDIEEMYLMSLCKHNINPRSAFSWWAAYLNQNPDKKVFVSTSSTAQETLKYKYSLTTNEQSPIDSGKWIYVPFDRDKQPKITMRPMFSLLLVVNNDAATINDTLNSILDQDYKHYEVVIIDNASTDGSGKICQQAIVGKDNVTFFKLWTKVKNVEAWNIALDIAQGYYVSFLKGNDRFLTNAFTRIYLVTYLKKFDIVHSFAWLTENDKGNVAFGAKKCSEQHDAKFIATKTEVVSTEGQDAVTLFLNQQINNFLGTKIYSRGFLLDKEIKFDELLEDDESERYFQMKCFLKSKYFVYASHAVYITPTPKPPVADKAVAQTPKPPVADKAVTPTPKPPVADKAVAQTPKPPVADKAVAQTPKPPVADKAVAQTPKPPVADKAVAQTPKPPVADKAVTPTPKPPVADKAVAQTPNPPVADKAVTPTPKPPVADKAVAQTPKPPVADKAVAPTPKPPVADKAVTPTPKPPVTDKAVAQTPKPPVADKAVTPTPKPPVADKAVAPTPKPPVADKAVAPTPKPPVTDKAVAPTPKPPVADKAVAPTPKPPVADKAVAPTPKTPVADKAVAPTPKPPVADKAVAPTPKPPVADKAVAPTPKPPVADKAVTPTPKPPVADKAVTPTPKPPVADKAVTPTPKPPVADKAVAPTPKPLVADKAVAPTPKPLVADKAVAPTPKPLVADKAVTPTPKPPVADKAVAPTPKPPVADKAVTPTPKPPVADKAVTPTPKPPVADKAVVSTKLSITNNINSQIIDKFNLYFTARIDVKLLSTIGDFQILKVSDYRATIWKPKWFQKNGIGYQIQSYAGKLDIIAKATIDGKIRVSLKGIDVRAPEDNSKRIPYWIDYTKLTVNAKTIFDTLTPAWHDKVYPYTMDVKAGEEVQIQVEWLPHRSDF